MNSEFLLDTPGARSRLLERLAEKLYVHDCSVFAYCLMSNHIHLAALIGKMRVDRLMQGLLGSLAMTINIRNDRIGHAFANRFTNKQLPRGRVGFLVSYIHNNEQRADLVSSPRWSRWSSHRAYLGLAPRPDWLEVGLGLELCGFDDTEDGREQFHQMVVSRAEDPRQPEMSEPDAILPSSWAGPPQVAVSVTCDLFGIDPDALGSGSRVHPAPRARGAALLAWCDGLGRRAVEILPHLGVTAAAASRAMSRGRSDRRTLTMAEQILDVVTRH